MNVQHLNTQLSKYPITVQDKGWTYGVWYCGTSFLKAHMLGQHPSGYLKRLVNLFPDCKDWLHAPSGILPHGLIDGRRHTTLDLVSRKEGCPEYIGNVNNLPFPDCSFDIVETDPPYGREWEASYGTGRYPRYKALSEFHRVLRPNGYLCWLDIRYPMFRRKYWKIVGLIGIITGAERLTRSLSIFQKIEEGEGNSSQH